MGVFLSDRADDIALLESFFDEFRKRWNDLGYPHQPTVIGDTGVERITDYAGEIFSEHFSSPSHYQRIAAFLVLATACPCLAIRVDGKPVLNQESRKWFFSRANFILIPPCFKLLERQYPGAPHWPGWPPSGIVVQIVALLTLLDIGDLVESGTNKHSTKGVAKAITALAVILQLWVEYGNGHDDLGTLLGDTGLLC